MDEVRDILLSWRRPSHWTCLELMAVEDPMLPEDIDLMWAGGFSRSIYEIDVEILTLILPCVLEYFRRISQFQEFFPMAEPDETDVTDQTTKKRAVNLLGDYLVERALEHPSFAQFLFWQLKMRSKEISTGRETRDNIFARLLGLLLHRMQQVTHSFLPILIRTI